MAGALTMTACAKDSGDNSASGDDGGSAGECVTAQAPPPVEASSDEREAATDVDASDLKVALAFDVGGRGDASFNDAAAAGVDQAEEDMGVGDTTESTAAGTESEDAKQQRLTQMADKGYDPIIAVGFAYADALKAVAPEFPDTQFAIVDDDSVDEPNVTPLVFAEEQGSFLAGVAAVYKSQNCHVGFVGGVDTPLIKKFEAGFVQGAEAVSDNVTVEVDYLTPAGDISGFNDPGKGNVVGKAQLNKGADVLYHAAGASGKGVFEAAAAGDALAIGVDSDQYEQKTVADVKDVIMTSMLKRVDVAVYDYIRALAEDDLDSLPERFDLSVDGVGYSTSGGQVDDIAEVLNGYKKQIVDGEIEVSATP
ncbi:BMP family ABC transporter substrate-binding protein [Saccharomonospora piscinae]|uniref:BMP family ABC transporter substrate-binding protein n=1 Tax=Saccharomonospora piscinae TaxID=687388 RepID=A0A1V9A217_SACPI|nr:BMP family ABC transporter substrate-binding protein [Saccharomonospora piscinae]OQO91185.1 BMP family ABC transporter substrate-binding protein [Saccharomonospora piscinae]TLW94006.1 BMP family ABC transporter substrate-binding protein [Saccharomonospora piscinae]